MNRILILVAIVAASLSLGAGANATPPQIPGCTSLTVSAPARSYSDMLGINWWMSARAAAPIPSVLCYPPASPALVAAYYAAMGRFFVLYRAFPASPTARQWKARFGPLVKRAIAADQAALALLLASESANLQAELIELDCGPPHHLVGHCDNNDPAPTCACNEGANGENQDVIPFQADAVALQKIAGLTLTSAKALDRGP